MTPQELAQHFENPRTSPSGNYTARCPVVEHGAGKGDRSRSLSIYVDKAGKTRFDCKAGCDGKAVLSAVGLTFPEINGADVTRPATKSQAPPEGKIKRVKEWTWCDGETWTAPLFYHVRGEYVGGLKNGEKTMWFESGDSNPAQRKKAIPPGCERPLWKQHQLAAADLVIVVEGEQCADRVEEIIPHLYPAHDPGKVVVTTLFSGAQSPWHPAYTAFFKGKAVCLLADNDAPGIKYVAMIAKNVTPVARHVKQVHFPMLRPKGDVVDYLDDRPYHSAPELRAWIDDPESSKHGGHIEEAKSEPRKTSSLEVVSIREVQPRKINWLWFPYLAQGMLHILNGDAYAGKTFIAMALSAGITLGRLPLTSEPCTPGNVLYLQEENPVHEVMRPRYDSLGGDLDRFLLIRGSIWNDGEKDHRQRISLSDVDLLEEAFERYQPRLLVIDPFQGYIGAGVDMYRANEIRPIMEGLGRLAERYQTAVLLMRHFTKGSVGTKAMHRGMGSVDFTNVARSELFAGILPDEDGVVPRGGSGPRALVHGASNIGPIGESLEYRIGDDGVFGWTGKLDLNLDQLMNPEIPQDGESRGALKEACEWLKDYLTPNSRNSKEVEKAAKQGDIAQKTLQRAKFVLQVKSRKTSVAGGWIWFLPGCGTEKEDGSGPMPVQ
jgi:AAA domain